MKAADLHSRITDSEDFIILGQHLLPLCIGHVEMLAKFGCEFPSNPGELVTAILVCAMKPRCVLAWFKSNELDERLQKIGESAGVWDFQEKLALWNEYWDYNTKLPTVVRDDAPTERAESGVPWHQFLRSVLLAKLNYRPYEIADTPVLRAQWDIVGLQYAEGKVRVFTEDISDAKPLTDEESNDIKARALESLKLMEGK